MTKQPSTAQAGEQATPRPWHVCPLPPNGESMLVVGAGGEKIAALYYDADKTDAELIIRSVNAHDALVAALRSTGDFINSLMRIGRELEYQAKFCQCLSTPNEAIMTLARVIQHEAERAARDVQAFV